MVRGVILRCGTDEGGVAKRVGGPWRNITQRYRDTEGMREKEGTRKLGGPKRNITMRNGWRKRSVRSVISHRGTETQRGREKRRG